MRYTDQKLSRWKAALEAGQTLRFPGGKLASTPEELTALLETHPNLLENILQEEAPLETLSTLTPGSALLIADGRLPALGEGAKWCAPGDFKCYLEAGEDDNSGLVRELLVGPFREPDDRNDHELTPGNFLTDPEWDYVVGGARTEVMHLVQEIGLNPLEERPEDSKPRGESWLAERAAADARAAELESRIAELTTKNAELTAQVAQLSAAPSASLPEDIRERLVAIKGIGEAKADEILEALKL